jgi:hypothetical protein
MTEQVRGKAIHAARKAATFRPDGEFEDQPRRAREVGRALRAVLGGLPNTHNSLGTGETGALPCA